MDGEWRFFAPLDITSEKNSNDNKDSGNKDSDNEDSGTKNGNSSLKYGHLRLVKDDQPLEQIVTGSYSENGDDGDECA